MEYSLINYRRSFYPTRRMRKINHAIWR